MSDPKQEVNSLEQPTHGYKPSIDPNEYLRWMLFICFAFFLFSIFVCGTGLLQIFETTPLMAIGVDANGNPIPVEGYPQFYCGSAGACFFAFVLAILVIVIIQD